VFANQRALTLMGPSLGPDQGTGLIGGTLKAFVAGTDDAYPDARLPVRRALEGEEDAFAHDLEIIRGDERVPLEAWANPVRDAEGRIVYAVAAFQNVSDRRKAEVERMQRVESERSLERIRELDAMRTRFVNIAAHELFTPLTPLRLQVKYLSHSLKDVLEPKQSRAIQVIDRNFERLQRVVNQILEVAQLQGESLETITQPTDLTTLVADVAHRAQGRAHERQVRVEATGPDANVLVSGNAHRLDKATTNLIENAVKYSPAQSTVRVRLAVKGNEAIFEVSDEGPGLDPAEAEEAFRPFGRAAQTEGDVADEGLGMGLYVAKTIIERHGGRIWLHSDGKGAGARAGFALPVANVVDGPRGPQALTKGT
jgi:signal transduction histidine kinase